MGSECPGKLQVWEWGRNGKVAEVLRDFLPLSIDLGNPQLQGDFHSLIFFFIPTRVKEKKPKNE